MERLTVRRGKDNTATPKKAYEEYTEQEPIDCITFCKTQDDCMVCPIGACFDKLADYEDAEEDGRLFRSRFKIGQTIYTINPTDDYIDCDTYYIASYLIADVSARGTIEVDTLEEWSPEYQKTFTIYETYEEAEAKLKEMEKKNERG